MGATYPAVVAAARAAFAALGLRLRVEGDDRVPAAGPVILAANHTSYLDFAFLGLAARRSRRYVRFLARHDIWAHPPGGPLMRGMGHVPVDRRVPAHAYLRARALLHAGEAVGIFPEAGVSLSWTVRPILPGAVALAQATGAPLLPVAIEGGQRIYTARRRLDLRRHRSVSIVVGQPLAVDHCDLAEGTRRLGRNLQGLLESVQRRPEHRPRPDEADRWWYPAHLGGTAPTQEEAAPLETTRSRRALAFGEPRRG